VILRPAGFPPEAGEGIMRVWLEILREKHPCVAWVPADRTTTSRTPTSDELVPAASKQLTDAA
jgi:hypothetical protein